MSSIQYLNERVAEYEFGLQKATENQANAAEMLRIARQKRAEAINAQYSDFSSPAEKGVNGAIESAIDGVVNMYERNLAACNSEITRLNGRLASIRKELEAACQAEQMADYQEEQQAEADAELEAAYQAELEAQGSEMEAEAEAAKNQ